MRSSHEAKERLLSSSDPTSSADRSNDADLVEPKESPQQESDGPQTWHKTAKSEDAKSGKGPRYRLSRAQFILCVTAIFLSNFSNATDAGFSASTHAAVAAAFDRNNLSSWPVNSFVITSLILQPLYGRTSDHLGRKIPYLAASSFFVIGIILCVSTTAWSGLIAARALCGLGAAGTSTMGSVVLTDVVGIEKRGYYQSINYVVYGAGSALGSSLGGILVEKFGWSSIYLAQCPTSLTSLILLASALPSGPHLNVQSNHRDHVAKEPSNYLSGYDWTGSVCLTAVLISLVALLTIGGNLYSWSHPLVILAGILFLAFTAIFVYVEKRAEKPVIPLYLMHRFPVWNIMLVGFLSSMINYMVLYNIPMFFQTVHLDPARKAGFRLLVPSIAFTISSAMAGSIIAKLETPAFTLRIGQAFLLVGSFGLVTMVAVFPRFNVPDWVYDAMLFAPTVGVGMIAPSTVLTLLNITPVADYAVANTALIMTRSLGVLVATALGTTTLQNVFQAALPRHYNEESKAIVEKVRENAGVMLQLDEPMKSQLVNAYRESFTAIFAICALSAVVVVLGMLPVRVKGFGDVERRSGERSSSSESEGRIDCEYDSSGEDIELDSLDSKDKEDV